MRITKISTATGIEHTMDIEVTFYQLWAIKQPGAVAIEIAPLLSAAEHRFLQTGITAIEWSVLGLDEEADRDIIHYGQLADRDLDRWSLYPERF